MVICVVPCPVLSMTDDVVLLAWQMAIFLVKPLCTGRLGEYCITEPGRCNHPKLTCYFSEVQREYTSFS